jgi:hypothetical protein
MPTERSRQTLQEAYEEANPGRPTGSPKDLAPSTSPVALLSTLADLVELASEYPEARTPDLRNRFVYHPPATQQRRELHEQIRATVRATAEVLDGLVPAGREKSLMLTNLEQALFWGSAAVARTPS